MTTVAGNRVRLTLLVVLLTEKKGLTLKIGIFCFVLIINRVLLKPARYFFLIFFFFIAVKIFFPETQKSLFLLFFVCFVSGVCVCICMRALVCMREGVRTLVDQSFSDRLRVLNMLFSLY